MLDRKESVGPAHPFPQPSPLDSSLDSHHTVICMPPRYCFGAGQYRALILEKCPPQANPELSGTGNGQPPLEVDWLSKRISHNLGMYTKRKTRKTGHQKSPAVGGGSASPAGLADEWREPSQDVRLSWGAGRLAHRREGVGRPPWERPPGAPAIDLRPPP